MRRSAGAIVALSIMAVLAPAVAVGQSVSPPPPSPEAAVTTSPGPVQTGVFLLCPVESSAATCPLPPGLLAANIHDSFTLMVPADGWQEERTEPEELSPTLRLSRTAAPDQRVTVDSGDTVIRMDDSDVASLLPENLPMAAATPEAVQVGGASGFRVDLEPTDASSIVVERVGDVPLLPGRRYRLFVLQVPMFQEATIKVVIVDAPTADFEALLAEADSILAGLRFSGSG